MTEGRRVSVFVTDTTRPGSFADGVEQRDRDNATRKRDNARDTVSAYLYGDWSIVSWGSAPRGTAFEGWTGFYLDGPADGGFGADNQRARLASGMLYSIVLEG